MTTIKICRVCKKSKHLKDFCKNKTCNDGYTNICKHCDHAKQKRYRTKIKSPANTGMLKIVSIKWL